MNRPGYTLKAAGLPIVLIAGLYVGATPASAEKTAEQIKCEEEGGSWVDKGNGNTFCFKRLPPMQKADRPSGGHPAGPATATINDSRSNIEGRTAAPAAAKQDQSHDVHELEKISRAGSGGTLGSSEEAPGYTVSGTVKNHQGIAADCAASPAGVAGMSDEGKAPERCASRPRPERP